MVAAGAERSPPANPIARKSLNLASYFVFLLAQLFSLSASNTGSGRSLLYTVRFAEVVYVLHVFQKKSKRGIATPKKELDLIRKRLKLAELEYKRRSAAGGQA